MQHPPELKTKFLELRAQGVSYGRIAEAIGVSKPTLIQWGKDMAEETADLQAAQRELIREKLLGNFEQWLGRQVHHFNRLDEEFGRREFKYSPTESVFRMMMASRKLLDRYFFEDDRPSRRRESRVKAAPQSLPPRGEGQDEGQTSTSVRTPASAASATAGTAEPEGRAPSSPMPAQQSEIPNSKAENPSKTQPLPNQNRGSSSSDSLEGDAPRGPQPKAEIPNPQSEMESGAPVYSENPAKTQPFPGQNFEVHNPALSSPPVAEVGRAIPRAPHALGNSAAESKIENPNSKIPWSRIPSRNAESKINAQSPLTIQDSPEADFGGESIPVSPHESTREWLERQGIQVSRTPKGARIIPAG